MCTPVHRFVVCVVSSPIIQQSPEHLLVTVDQKEAILHCRHGDNDYSYMYWYQQNSSGGSWSLLECSSIQNPHIWKQGSALKDMLKRMHFYPYTTYLVRMEQCITVQQVDTVIQFPLIPDKNCLQYIAPVHIYNIESNILHLEGTGGFVV